MYAVSGVTTGNEVVGAGQTQKISETTTIYAPKSLYAPFYTPPMQIDTKLYDGDSSYKQSRAVYDYDTYGNVTKEELQGDVSDTTNNRTIAGTFSPNTGNWIVGLSATEDIYQGIGTTTKVAGKMFYYDDLAACDATPTNNQTPVYGKLTRVVSWLNGGTNSEVRTAYDSYGNPTCLRDPKGYTSTIGYDTSNTFPITTTNPLGQQTSTQYYGDNGQVASGTGLYGQVKSVTDFNGAVKRPSTSTSSLSAPTALAANSFLPVIPA
jgi:hypothetical protein